MSEVVFDLGGPRFVGATGYHVAIGFVPYGHAAGAEALAFKLTDASYVQPTESVEHILWWRASEGSLLSHRL